MVETEEGRSRYGVVYGIAAYGLWGLIPLYFKAVAQVAPVEVLAHRALWSFVMLVVLVHALGRWRELWWGLHSSTRDALRAAREYRIEVVEPD